MPAIIRTHAGESAPREIPSSPPILKSERPERVSGTKVVTVSVPALNRLEMATPARTRVIFDAPVFLAMKYTSITAASAPMKADSDLTPKVVGNIARLRTTAKPAPALTPIMFGEARGLPRTACITAPDTARAAPARKPPSTRGSLTQ